MIEDSPGVREIVTVLPDHSRHVAKVMRFVLTESERDEVFQLQSRLYTDASLQQRLKIGTRASAGTPPIPSPPARYIKTIDLQIFHSQDIDSAALSGFHIPPRARMVVHRGHRVRRSVPRLGRSSFHAGLGPLPHRKEQPDHARRPPAHLYLLRFGPAA